MNTWQDAVVQIVLILIGLAFTYMGNVLVKNKKAVALIQVLTPLAKAAVMAAQKLGLDKGLTGAMQKNEAVQAVISGLANAGFTKVDQATIENAVEAAYASLKDTLDKAYGNGTDVKAGLDSNTVALKPSESSTEPHGTNDDTLKAPVIKVDTPIEASGSTDTSTK